MIARTTRASRWLAPALVLLATVAVYGRTVGFPFVFDDSMFILTNPFVDSASNIPRFFTEPEWSGIATAQMNYYPPYFCSGCPGITGRSESTRRDGASARSCCTVSTFSSCISWRCGWPASRSRRALCSPHWP